MKYVMLRRASFRFPVVFPDHIEHSQLQGADVVSAGFVTMDENGTARTYGKSTSLGKSPTKGDETILTEFLAGREAMIHFVQQID